MRNCKFHQLMFCALTNIQVSNSLCLDGPSLGWNSFDFHLLVISHYVCSTKIHITFFSYLLTTLTFKVVTLGEPRSEKATFGISPEGFNYTYCKDNEDK